MLRQTRRTVAAVLASALTALWLMAIPASAQAEQILTWTADGGTNAYRSAPATATAGAATIVFENSLATGNTVGMPHTLTFDTSTPGYNHDVDLNIFASPFDANGGRHQASVTLAPGKYRYFCAIQGHLLMVGELVVTDGGGGDTTAPTVNATVSGDQNPGGDYVGSATVTVDASDSGSGVASVEYNVDGGAFLPYTAPVVIDQVGAHMVHFRATDVAGNVSPEGMVSFTVAEPADTTAPTVTAVVSGNQDAAGDYIASATVTVSASDSGSGVASVEYEIDDTGFRPYTGPVTITAIGDHAVQFRATDVAGNVSADGSVGFTVVEPAEEDTTAPTVTAVVSGNQDAAGDYVASATVTVTASDSQSGVASVEYELDGTWAAYTGPVTVTALGEHTVRHRATDVAGNVSTVGSVAFTVVAPAEEDTTAPTVSALVTGEQDDNGDYVGNALVTVTAEDAQSGVAGVEYNVDGGAFLPYTEPVLVNEVGEHMVHFRATDVAGNTSAEGMAAFTVVAAPVEDTTPPTVTAVVTGEKDGSGAYIGSATVTITATDTESGVDVVSYNVDGGPFVPYTGPVVVNAAGAHMVHFRATDLAGNLSPEGMAAFTVVEPAEEDTTAPTVTAAVSGNQDANGAYLDSATVTIAATDAQSGVATVEYTLDGGAWTPYTEPLTVGTAGSHTVGYRATDVAGNTSTPATTTFTVTEPGSDACPDSDTRATVIIGAEDTGVANVDTGHGCTLNDLIAETATYANHGAFVAHVDKLTDDLVTNGILPKQDKARIIRAAARSDIGR